MDQGFGNYAVEVRGAAEGGNILDVSVKVKLPKHEKRKELLKEYKGVVSSHEEFIARIIAAYKNAGGDS